MKSNVLAGLALSGLSLLFISSPTLADYEGDALVVTASRSEQSATAPLASVSVIDRARIERSQAPDLLELLRLEAGVDVARTGGPGGQTSVFLRGSNSNHVLILIDGVRAAAAGTGGFAWELLDPALVERIEIVRGPRAARWGSDAIGGVIQIFTRKPDGVQVRAGYGEYDDRSLSAGIGTSAVGLTAAWRRVGGFSAQNERGFAFDPDDDGFENASLAANGDHALGSGRLSWHARLASGDVEFDRGESDTLNYAGRVEYSLTDRRDWRWLASIAAHRDRLETATAFGESEAITRRLQTAVQGETRLGRSTHLIVGAEAWRESGVRRNSWSDSRNNLGVWSGIDGRHGSFDYETSLRIDRDELFGSAVSGNLAGGWRPTDDWRLRAGVGRGFRAPNFSQLFSPGFDGLFAGNPELDPETSLSTELALQWFPGTNHQFDLALFDTRIDDLIDFSGPDFQAVNIRRARILGAELSHRFTSEDWVSRFQLTWQDPEDRDSGLPLLRRPEEKASWSIDRRFSGGGWIGTELLYTGERFDVGQERLGSYALVNLRAGWPLPAGLRLEGRLENLTDRGYEQLVGFNTPGRSFWVALSWARDR
ncbi:MAG: TonB-dependent receptor [Gammaproteobacteria bacterium]|jgi:vitamin B12 transporter|nr:TonB-dependent receptor [Gammaproteobacteria bacterium]